MEPTTKTERERYLAGELTHRQYYAMVVDRAGIHLEVDHHLVQSALNSRDEHYNDIRMSYFDIQALCAKRAIRAALNTMGDFWSIAGGVCVMKEAVRQAVERMQSGHPGGAITQKKIRRPK